MVYRDMFKAVYRKLLEARDPVRYAEKLGVNHGENFHIYGKIVWGSEPWIITLGDNVYLASGTKFITHDGGTLILRAEIPDLEITKPIVVGSNVYMGNDVTLLPGVHVGSNVIIGAGAIVTKDIPDNSVAAGVPARVIKTLDEYKQKVCAESLHLGHLKGKEKDMALREYYGYSG